MLSHLVSLLFISAVALLPRVTSGPGAGLVLLVALVAVSLPIPWLHWDETRHLSTRDETFQLAAPVAHRFPPPLDRAVEDGGTVVAKVGLFESLRTVA